jgi:hypothetical protein
MTFGILRRPVSTLISAIQSNMKHPSLSSLLPIVARRQPRFCVVRASAFLLLLLGWQRQTCSVLADSVVFTIDPARSHIALSGDVTIPAVGTCAFQAQGSDSLVASYSGTIFVELAPPMIGFPGGSVIKASNTGAWQPAVGGVSGSALANYGIVVHPPFTTASSAIRNLRLDLTSPMALLSDGGFDASQLVTSYLTSAAPPPSMDYLVSSPLPGMSTNGTARLTDRGTNGPSTAYLTNGAGRLTLVLPVNTTNTSTLAGNPTTVILQGQIVATAPATAWPLTVSMELEAGQVTLAWPSLPGQSFAVQSKPDWAASWNPATGTMTVYPNTTTWTGNASGQAGFYRVVME